MDSVTFNQNMTAKIKLARNLIAAGVDPDEYVCIAGQEYRVRDVAETLTPAEAPELWPIN